MTGSRETSSSSGVSPESPDGHSSLPPKAAATSGSAPLVPGDGAAPSATAPGAGSRRLWILLGIAALVCAIGCAWWWRAAHDDSVSRAEGRDTVLLTATKGIEVMNTLDYRSLDRGLQTWESVTTGKLRDSIAAIPDEERRLLAEQKKVSDGKVLSAAVTSLDGSTATVIAAVEVTVRDDQDEPTIKRNRFSATMMKIGSQWKIEDLAQVAVNLS